MHGALIVRRLCVLLGAEKVHSEFSTILESESDLDFASNMVQAIFCSCWLNLVSCDMIRPWKPGVVLITLQGA
ncbi:hypothetical protein ACP4OV_027826 [Aristida adscensionis]